MRIGSVAKKCVKSIVVLVDVQNREITLGDGVTVTTPASLKRTVIQGAEEWLVKGRRALDPPL